MATCLHPKVIYSKVVPCGKCPVCRQNLRQSKGDRFLLASAFNKKAGGSNFFITLTYDDDHINYARSPCSHSDEWYPCFSKKDIRLFFHYIRREGKEVKYFIASEYGFKTHRPHYHGILLFKDNIRIDVVIDLLKKCWTKGFIQVSALNDSRVQYASKYVLKDDYFYLMIRKQIVVPEVQQYVVDNWDMCKPFTLISEHFLSDEAIAFLNEYIWNDGNTREYFEFSGKRVNFDMYIKNHIDPSLLEELRALRKNDIEYQDRLLRSGLANSVVCKDFYGREYLKSNYTKDRQILEHRARLQMLKKGVTL